MSFLATVALLCLVTALCCATPGIFIVLGKRSMTVEAVSHAMLPGVVLGFVFTRNLSSPLLLVSATLIALLVVWLLTALGNTGLLARHGLLGIALPPLLAFAVLLITAYASDLHLDTHTVLLGDLNLLALDNLCIAGNCFGPGHLYLLGGLLLANLLFVYTARKQLFSLTFDPEFATLAGLKPERFNAVLMLLTALTVTAAFAAVGSILVLAFVVLPAAAARLLSTRLQVIMPLTLLLAAAGSQLGFWFSYHTNLPTSAGIAAVYGVLFMLTLAVYALSANTRAHRGLQPAA